MNVTGGHALKAAAFVVEKQGVPNWGMLRVLRICSAQSADTRCLFAIYMLEFLGCCDVDACLHDIEMFEVDGGGLLCDGTE